jgi:hypothetical protein
MAGLDGFCARPAHQIVTIGAEFTLLAIGALTGHKPEWPRGWDGR